MTELIPAINEIVRFGLAPNLTVPDKEKLLERNLVKIYALYFDIEPTLEDIDHPDFDRSGLTGIRQNVESNFKDYGLYKAVLDINDLDNLGENGIGDAIDDFSDIIYDLLEVKWRLENNSLADGIRFFKFIFEQHTKQHILHLLNYIEQKKG